MLEAAARADKLQEDGDWQGALTWHRILDAIHRLQAKAPAEGEKVRRTATFAEAHTVTDKLSEIPRQPLGRLGQDGVEFVSEVALLPIAPSRSSHEAGHLIRGTTSAAGLNFLHPAGLHLAFFQAL